MALLGNGRRTATLESKEPCIFAVLEKSTFLASLSLNTLNYFCNSLFNFVRVC